MSILKRSGPGSALLSALALCSARPSSAQPSATHGVLLGRFPILRDVWRFEMEIYMKRKGRRPPVWSSQAPAPTRILQRAHKRASIQRDLLARITVISNLNDVLHCLLLIYRLTPDISVVSQNLGQTCLLSQLAGVKSLNKNSFWFN